MLMFGNECKYTSFLFLLEQQYTCNSDETLKAYVRQSHWIGIQMMAEYISLENMKFGTLTSGIGTVSQKKRLSRGGLLCQPVVL